MEPTADKTPTHQLVTLDGKAHGSAEIPKEELTMADTVAGEAAHRASPGATRRTTIAVGTQRREEKLQGGKGDMAPGREISGEKNQARPRGGGSKRHDRSWINSRAATREHARRLGKTGGIFRELLTPAVPTTKKSLPPGKEK